MNRVPPTAHVEQRGAAMIEPVAAPDTVLPDESAACRQDGPPELTKLLDAAREHARSTNIDDHRTALALLCAYRDRALEAGRPELLLDAIPVTKRLASDEYAPDAEQFLDTTQRMLARWPPQAADFAGRLRNLRLSELQAEAEDARDEIKDQFTQVDALAALVAGAGAVFAVVGALTAGLGFAFPDIAGGTIQFVAAATGCVGVIVATGAFLFRLIVKSYADGEVRDIERNTEIQVALAGTEGLPEPSGGAHPAGAEYFGNLVRINVRNLSDYYTQVRVHTNNSFWASIIVGGLGFVLVCIGVGYGIAGSDDKTVSYVAAGSGVIVEFISGVFFYLYNRTVRQLKSYHDSLLDVQNILLSFRIVEESAPEHRSRLLQDILGFLLQKRAQESVRAEP